MEKYYRIIAYTPYCGEEFVGHFTCSDNDPSSVERMRGFADILIADNAAEHAYDHVDEFTDDEGLEDYYNGCGALFQEIDYNTFMEEAFEGEEDWE